MFDVLIKNGKTEREQPIEIGINGSQIAALAPKLEGASGKQEIDLHHEAYVSAGWIDDHAHCYEKLTLYYDDPDEDGYYRYALSPEENVVLSRSRINRLFQDSLIKVDHSLNH